MLIASLDNPFINRPITEIFGNLRTGIVSTESFLVDILFKDISQNIGVNFVIASPRSVVKVPRVTGE